MRLVFLLFTFSVLTNSARSEEHAEIANARTEERKGSSYGHQDYYAGQSSGGGGSDGTGSGGGSGGSGGDSWGGGGGGSSSYSTQGSGYRGGYGQETGFTRGPTHGDSYSQVDSYSPQGQGFGHEQADSISGYSQVRGPPYENQGSNKENSHYKGQGGNNFEDHFKNGYATTQATTYGSTYKSVLGGGGGVGESLENDHQGPVYLSSMMDQLHTERNQIMGPTPVPDEGLLPDFGSGQKFPISHEQLTALYKTAVKQSENLDLTKHHQQGEANHVEHGDDTSSSPGYYYYYFPITDLPDESSTESSTDMTNDMGDGDMQQGRPVEPLFVAMASFIGISTLFAFSVLFLPKFGSRKRSDPTNNNHLAPLTNIVLDALDPTEIENKSGTLTKRIVEKKEEVEDEYEHDVSNTCRARLECEMGRVLRRMKMHQGPLRALERILPEAMGKQVQRVREAAHRRHKCSTIRCDVSSAA